VIAAAVNNILMKFLLWRRWQLLVLLPLVLTQCILQLITSGEQLQLTTSIAQGGDNSTQTADVVRRSLLSYAYYQYTGLFIVGVIQGVAFVVRGSMHGKHTRTLVHLRPPPPPQRNALPPQNPFPPLTPSHPASSLSSLTHTCFHRIDHILLL